MQKGFAGVYILAGLVILTVLGGAYYLGTIKNKPQSQNPVVISQVNPTSTSQPIQVTPSSSPDEIVNWKTYTSEKFTFKYPPDWLIEDPKPYGQLVRLTYMEGKDKYKFIVETGGRGGPTADNIENKPLMFQGFKFNRRTWINVGKPFFISFAPDEGGFEFFNHVEISLPPEDADKYIKIFDQILSTFKFTDQNQIVNTLQPADAQTSAAGVCPDYTSGNTVTIILNQDIPSPRCARVLANQNLRIINNTSQAVTFTLGQNTLSINPNQIQTITQTFGTYLAPGVHNSRTSLYGGGGPEIWF